MESAKLSETTCSATKKIFVFFSNPVKKKYIFVIFVSKLPGTAISYIYVLAEDSYFLMNNIFWMKTGFLCL